MANIPSKFQACFSYKRVLPFNPSLLSKFLHKSAQMAIRIRSVISNAKQIIRQQSVAAKKQEAVPKGYIPVYVGEEGEKKRYVVPLSYLSHPAFQELLLSVEEEFGFNHPMGGLTLPCTQEAFFNLTCALNC